MPPGSRPICCGFPPEAATHVRDLRPGLLEFLNGGPSLMQAWDRHNHLRYRKMRLFLQTDRRPGFTRRAGPPSVLDLPAWAYQEGVSSEDLAFACRSSGYTTSRSALSPLGTAVEGSLTCPIDSRAGTALRSAETLGRGLDTSLAGAGADLKGSCKPL